MDANRQSIRHFFTYFEKMGGVEAMLRKHVLADPARGFQPEFVLFFESDAASAKDRLRLGFTGRDTIRSARERFQRQVTQDSSAVSVYHNFWGLPFLADLDQSRRRIAILHSDWPGLATALRPQSDLVDAILCVSQSLCDFVRATLPDFPADRIGLLPYPIYPPEAAPHPIPAGHPLRLGFCGRVSQDQKRVDRIPEFCRLLDGRGVDYEFEVLGDGPRQTWLESALSGNHKVRFHGRRSGPEYWQILSSWDAIAFFSDYEGLPIAMLEALSQGVLPIFPRILCGGDAYVQRLAPELLYNPGEMGQMADCVGWLRSLSEERLRQLQAKAVLLSKPHQGDSYFDLFAQTIRRTLAQPRISVSQWQPRPPFWTDFLPFGVLSRLFPAGYYRTPRPKSAKAVPTN